MDSPVKSNILIYTPTTLSGTKRKRKTSLDLADLTHTLQWKQAAPQLSTAQQAMPSHAVKYVDSHMKLPIANKLIPLPR
jgi:hypothetical protein